MTAECSVKDIQDNTECSVKDSLTVLSLCWGTETSNSRTGCQEEGGVKTVTVQRGEMWQRNRNLYSGKHLQCFSQTREIGNWPVLTNVKCDPGK